MSCNSEACTIIRQSSGDKFLHSDGLHTKEAIDLFRYVSKSDLHPQRPTSDRIKDAIYNVNDKWIMQQTLWSSRLKAVVHALSFGGCEWFRWSLSFRCFSHDSSLMSPQLLDLAISTYDRDLGKLDLSGEAGSSFDSHVYRAGAFGK